MDNKVDYGRVALLLSIVEKIATVCPQFMGTASAAMAELKEVNDAVAEAAAKNKLPPTSPLAPVEQPVPLPAGGIPTNELAPHDSVELNQVELQHSSSPPELHRVDPPDDPLDPNEPPPALRKI